MYRIGLIGNRAHQNTYGPIWHEREDCEIIAAAEHHEGKGEALSQLYGLEVSQDYDAVLEDPNVDIVSICTDFYLKRTLIKKALRLRQTQYSSIKPSREPLSKPEKLSILSQAHQTKCF